MKLVFHIHLIEVGNLNLKQLEKLINDRHYKNDPVVLGMFSLLKIQSKKIKSLEEKIELVIKSL